MLLVVADFAFAKPRNEGSAGRRARQRFYRCADEVRKLAENSRITSQEISKLADNSVDIAEQAGILLKEMAPNIQKIAGLVEEITASSNRHLS